MACLCSKTVAKKLFSYVIVLGDWFIKVITSYFCNNSLGILF